MNSATWWIMAAISFMISMILSAVYMFVNNADAAVILSLLQLGFVISGWVLWIIGLVSRFRRR